MPSRQTQSYLRNLFARRGIAPQHRYGQNFLVDLNIHELIVKAAEVGPQDVVLEVGPGAGAMTALMADRASAVVAVEIDPAMAALTAEAVAGRPNVRVVEADALARKNEINPEVLDHVRAGLAVAPDRRFKLVANLPYNVATPLVVESVERLPSVERWCVMVQREIADRFFAAPATKAYGAVSVLLQLTTKRTGFHPVSRTVFRPQPNVDSGLVAFRRKPLPENYAVVKRVVEGAFAHRRKTLANSLALAGVATREQAVAALDGVGRAPDVRAEALAPGDFVGLAGALT